MSVEVIFSGSETIGEYHSSGCWGSSTIRTFMRNRPLAHALVTGDHVHSPTPALVFGQRFHTLMDPSADFDRQYRRGPEGCDRRTRAWKSAAEAAEDDGAILLPAVEWDQLVAMRDAVFANPYAAALLADAEHEIAFRMTMPGTGFGVQCRADVLHRWSCICDLKTTCDLDAFSRAVLQYGYHQQAALYRWLIGKACGELLPFSIIAVEKEYPFRCRIYDLDDDLIDAGWRDMAQALDDIARCYDTGVWSDPVQQQVVTCPHHLLRESDPCAA